MCFQLRVFQKKCYSCIFSKHQRDRNIQVGEWEKNLVKFLFLSLSSLTYFHSGWCSTWEKFQSLGVVKPICLPTAPWHHKANAPIDCERWAWLTYRANVWFQGTSYCAKIPNPDGHIISDIFLGYALLKSVFSRDDTFGVIFLVTDQSFVDLVRMGVNNKISYILQVMDDNNFIQKWLALLSLSFQVCGKKKKSDS